jgi:hypothetical protein
MNADGDTHQAVRCGWQIFRKTVHSMASKPCIGTPKSFREPDKAPALFEDIPFLERRLVRLP